MTLRRRSEAERFWEKVDLLTPTGCWGWTGGKTSGGYGNFYLPPDVSMLAHRWAFEQEAEIPEGLQLDHLCRNRACVNPAHLEPVTAQENKARSLDARDRCLRGHEYVGRKCLSCAAERQRRYRERKKVTA